VVCFLYGINTRAQGDNPSVAQVWDLYDVLHYRFYVSSRLPLVAMVDRRCVRISLNGLPHAFCRMRVGIG
jgi:hypothetical protein